MPLSPSRSLGRGQKLVRLNGLCATRRRPAPPSTANARHVLRPTANPEPTPTRCLVLTAAPVCWHTVASQAVCKLALAFLDHVEQVAKPGTAVAELRDLDVGAAKFTASKWIHGQSSWPGACDRPIGTEIKSGPSGWRSVVQETGKTTSADTGAARLR
jgi:hypothetical protein